MRKRGLLWSAGSTPLFSVAYFQRSSLMPARSSGERCSTPSRSPISNAMRGSSNSPSRSTGRREVWGAAQAPSRRAATVRQRAVVGGHPGRGETRLRQTRRVQRVAPGRRMPRFGSPAIIVFKPVGPAEQACSADPRGRSSWNTSHGPSAHRGPLVSGSTDCGV